MIDTKSHFINGQHVTAENTIETSDIYNPATGKIIGKNPIATNKEIEQTVLSAKTAFPLWSAVTPIRRARVMFRFLEIMNKNAKKLATIISKEHGKTQEDAEGEVQRGIEIIEFATGILNHLKGEHSANVGTHVDSYSTRQPLGVVIGITPFNFPVMVPLWMFPIAIACGNTFILKPSERTPSAAIFMAELLKEAGIPDGVFNILHGDKTTVHALITHKDVAGVSFVGSTPVAQSIYHTATQHNKRVQALGGAKNHMIIMPDADIDQACDALMGAAYGSAGERCMAISIAIAIGDETADKIIQNLQPQIHALKINVSTEDNVDMGPLITKQHLNKVQNYIEIGKNEGADLLIDGRELSPVTGHESGFFIGGSLFDNVTKDMTIYKEEIFGPVLCVMRLNSYDEAIELINNHEYGNGTAIFTRDGGVARHFAQDVQAGMVGINIPIPVPVAFHSFGGWKKSLFGDHHIHGPEGVNFYTKIKTISSRWPKSKKSSVEFHFPQMD